MNQIQIEPPKRSTLPSLLSCALALVMAGSLVLFSLVAQKTVLSQAGSQPGNDRLIAPAAPPATASRPITVNLAEEDLSRSPLDVLEDVEKPVELTFDRSRPPATPADDAVALLPEPGAGAKKENTPPGKPKRRDRETQPDVDKKPNDPDLGSPNEPEPEHRAASEEDRKDKKLKKNKKDKKSKKTHREPPSGDGGHAYGHHKHDKKNKKKNKTKDHGKGKGKKGKDKNEGKKDKSEDTDEDGKEKGEFGGGGLSDSSEGSYEEGQATEYHKDGNEDTSEDEDEEGKGEEKGED